MEIHDVQFWRNKAHEYELLFIEQRKIANEYRKLTYEYRKKLGLEDDELENEFQH